MARRQILSLSERESLLALPDDELTLTRMAYFSEHDLALTLTGFSLFTGYFSQYAFPGRALCILNLSGWLYGEAMKLFLCEKPSQGRDIAAVVGAEKKWILIRDWHSGDLGETFTGAGQMCTVSSLATARNLKYL